MIELRADGSLPGAPTMGRICLMAHDGVLRYVDYREEREEDLLAYEKYLAFRGWKSEVLPLDQLEAEVQRLRKEGVPKDLAEIEQAAHLKSVFMKARDVAEKAAHAYFSACPVGPERIWASEVYENIRNATRV